MKQNNPIINALFTGIIVIGIQAVVYGAEDARGPTSGKCIK